MNQTLLACGFTSADEVRALLDRCGVTVRVPLKEFQIGYQQRHKVYPPKKNILRECEEAMKESK